MLLPANFKGKEGYIMTKRMCLKKQGFTLMELLVVIAIISLLLSILLPSLSKVKSMARKLVCSSNIRQINIACAGYMSENNFTFPEQNMFRPTNYVNEDLRLPFGDIGHGLTDPDPVYYCWAFRIDPYMDWDNDPESKACPAVKIDYEKDMIGTDNVGLSYFANSILTTFGGKKVRQSGDMISITELFEPAFTVRTFPRMRKLSGKDFEWTNPVESMVYGYNWMTDFEGNLWANKPHEQGELKGGRNYGFLDGHVEFYKWQDVTCGMFGLEINGSTKAQEPLQASGSRNEERMGLIKY